MLNPPPLPGLGGRQVGDGNLKEIQLGVQVAPAAYVDAATLTPSDLVKGLITYDKADGKNLQLPTVSDLEKTVSSAKVNSSFEFVVLALGAGTGTITTNTGWTLVGNMAVATTVAKRFRARKTAAGAWTLYQIA